MPRPLQVCYSGVLNVDRDEFGRKCERYVGNPESVLMLREAGIGMVRVSSAN